MKHIDLFSGIGGFAIASEMVWEEVEHIFCDNEPFAQAVLKKHWPNAPIYGDIKTLTADAESQRERGVAMEWEQDAQTTDTGEYDLLTGGFPCQPFSHAGRRRGTEDDRFLWPEMLRVICEFRPRWVVAENVAGLLSIERGVVFEQVCSDLERKGYSVQAFVIPAVAVNAPHKRDRVWIIAHTEHKQTRHAKRRRSDKRTSARAAGSNPHVADTKRSRYEGQEYQARSSAGHYSGIQSPNWSTDWTEVATRLCRVDDGLPRRLDRNPRLKALGNAIVPQVAAQIFKAIRESES